MQVVGYIYIALTAGKSASAGVGSVGILGLLLNVCGTDWRLDDWRAQWPVLIYIALPVSAILNRTTWFWWAVERHQLVWVTATPTIFSNVEKLSNMESVEMNSSPKSEFRSAKDPTVLRETRKGQQMPSRVKWVLSGPEQRKKMGSRVLDKSKCHAAQTSIDGHLEYSVEDTAVTPAIYLFISI